MKPRNITRRDAIWRGGMALAGTTLLSSPLFANVFPDLVESEIIPWSDQPPANPVPDVVGNLLKWEEADSWITPNDKHFTVAHYNKPIIDAETFRLDVSGMVDNPMSLSLADIKSMPKTDTTYTLECAGNHGFPWFLGGVGTAVWTGTRLAPILQEAGIQEGGIEIVFYGTDEGEEEVREIKMVQQFGRSMSVADAMSSHNLLAYEMNGEPLPRMSGFPLRMIAPGWYGIANVKWLKRIEVRANRYMGRFMARDYVTIREEEVDGASVWKETSVGRSLIKSAPAMVVHNNGTYRILGAAWGAPIARVEISVDGAAWKAARIVKGADAAYAWKFWEMEWPKPSSGEHAITVRAIDSNGVIQPTPDDPMITGKQTYWESNQQITRQIHI